MTLEQLRIFIAVAEREHLTRASEILNLTQSAVSSAIGQLEARYGVKLFDRVGRGISLTDAGRLFLIEARGVMARAQEAEMALYDAAGGRRGKLTIITSQTVGNYWITARMARYRKAYPGVALKLDITNTEKAATAVLSGEADLAIVEGEIDEPRLSITKIAGDEVVLALPQGHALASKTSLTRDDWASLEFVVREQGSGTRSILSELLLGMNMTLDDSHLVMELPSNEAVRSAIEAGAGASILSNLVVDQSCKAGLIQCLRLRLEPRNFSILRLKERDNSLALRGFSDICQGD